MNYIIYNYFANEYFNKNIFLLNFTLKVFKINRILTYCFII